MPQQHESERENDRYRRWGLLLLRVVVGFGFLAHGYAKAMRGPAHFAEILIALGVPLPRLAAWTTIAVELAGGVALIAGVFIELVSVPLIATLLVAIVTVHLRYGFSSIKLQAVTPEGPQFGPPGYETALLYLCALLALIGERRRHL
jgi:putative oxidoreductase